MSYSVSKLRKYDREKMRKGYARGPRYIELQPFCWMCNRTSGQATKEHVFPQWSFKYFTREQLQFEPYRVKIEGMGERRGPMPSKTLVESSVCNLCNNGWMASLESRVESIIFGENRTVHGERAETLARWFAKTSAIINVSQTYPLKWEQHARHQLANGMTGNVVVSVFRVDGSDLNWMQITMGTLEAPSGMPMSLYVLIAGLVHVCYIRMGDLVGVVVKYPWQLSNAMFSLPGTILWDKGAKKLDLDLIPKMTNWNEGIVNAKYVPSAFLSSSAFDHGVGVWGAPRKWEIFNAGSTRIVNMTDPYPV